MCGLVGFWSRAPLTVDAVPLVTRMADRLRHRGPDDAGAWADPDAGLVLGHRRLSILDLSAAGHQPMPSACGRFVIAFNGEIYNHNELRTRLERAGRAPAWRGHSDTETLLAGFVAWGVERTLGASVGMFALALWDRRERVLTLARDRMGEKPLYYGWQRGVLLFGSELKALQAFPGFGARVSRPALALLLRYNCIPEPWSIYEGVFKLPPGHLLQVGAGQELAQSQLEPRPWWTLGDVIGRAATTPYEGDEASAADDLERVLTQAVRGQMISDVPIGAFLSGGIDSSAVVALMQSVSAGKVKTFTIGFEESAFDEAEHARSVAAHLGTDHHDIHVRPGDALDLIPRLPTIYCEPFADSSQIPTFLVSQLARQHVTVALSGDGGDELFGGYNRHVQSLGIWNQLRRWPLAARRTLASLLQAIAPRRWDTALRQAGRLLPAHLRHRNPGEKAHKLASVLQLDNNADFYRRLRSHWEQPDVVILDCQEPVTLQAVAANGRAEGSLAEWMMAQDARTYLPDDILVKLDRAAMANGLETRVPLLDHRVVEFAWCLPIDYKIRDGQGKWLLRQVLYRHVPRSLIERPKMGFALPLDDWLRGPLQDWAEALLDEGRLRREGYFRPAPIRNLWDRHLSGRINGQYELWDVLMFQAWLEQQASAA